LEYILLLTGGDFSEEKDFAIIAFVGDIDIDHLKMISTVFSLALENVGVDNAGLYYGYINEIPSSVEELAQVIGRFGRCSSSTTDTDIVNVAYTFKRFLSILCCIHYTKTKMSTTKINKEMPELFAKSDLINVLWLLVLKLGCIQAQLANLSSRPGVDKLNMYYIKCPACHMCTQDWDKMFPPVQYRSLCLMLANTCITASAKNDIREIIYIFWNHKDTLKLLFPSCDCGLRKYHIESIFL